MNLHSIATPNVRRLIAAAVVVGGFAVAAPAARADDVIIGDYTFVVAPPAPPAPSGDSSYGKGDDPNSYGKGDLNGSTAPTSSPNSYGKGI